MAWLDSSLALFSTKITLIAKRCQRNGANELDRERESESAHFFRRRW